MLPNAQTVFLGNALSCGYFLSENIFYKKNLLALRLKIWAFLRIDQLYVQICVNILCVSFHSSSKNGKAFIHVFEVYRKEPKIFTFFFQADLKMFRGPDQKSVRATYALRAGGCPYMLYTIQQKYHVS